MTYEPISQIFHLQKSISTSEFIFIIHSNPQTTRNKMYKTQLNKNVCNISPFPFLTKQMALNSITRKPHLYEYLPDVLKCDIDIVYALLKQSLVYINQVPSVVFQSESLIRNLVSHQGLILEFASTELKSDEKLVTEAVKNTNEAFKFASDSLKTKKNFISKLLSRRYDIFDMLSHDIKNNLKVAKMAIKLDFNYFDCLSAENQSNFELKVFVSERSSGHFCRFIEKNKDNKLAECVIRKNRYMYYDLPDEMKESPHLSIAFMQSGGYIHRLPDKLTNDFEFAFRLLKECPRIHSFSGFSENIINDRDFIFSVVKELDIKQFLYSASKEVRSDRTFFMRLLDARVYGIARYVYGELVGDKLIEWRSCGHHKSIGDMKRNLDIHFKFRHVQQKRSLDINDDDDDDDNLFWKKIKF